MALRSTPFRTFANFRVSLTRIVACKRYMVILFDLNRVSPSLLRGQNALLNVCDDALLMSERRQDSPDQP